MSIGTLHLNLKKKWFDMVLSGEKRQEYRDYTPYWIVRMETVRREGIDNITFSNGYAKNRRQMIVGIDYITISTGGVTKWGAEIWKKKFIIHLRKRRNK